MIISTMAYRLERAIDSWVFMRRRNKSVPHREGREKQKERVGWGERKTSKVKQNKREKTLWKRKEREREIENNLGDERKKVREKIIWKKKRK